MLLVRHQDKPEAEPGKDQAGKNQPGKAEVARAAQPEPVIDLNEHPSQRLKRLNCPPASEEAAMSPEPCPAPETAADAVSPAPDAAEAIEALLVDFATRCEQFRQDCLSYLQGQMTLDGVTRSLSEATAVPERSFAGCSQQMSMDQLQRYGQIQKQIDTMMEQIFSEEIQRNRMILARVLENGEYFLINVLSRGIESAIYMLHSKERIKTERERRLAAFEQELRQLRAMVKVLKALEQTLAQPPEPGTLRRIELALGLFVDYFARLDRNDLLSACDRRALQLMKQHFLALQSGESAYPETIRSEHLARCFQQLDKLPSKEVLEPLFGHCRRLAQSCPEASWLDSLSAA